MVESNEHAGTQAGGDREELTRLVLEGLNRDLDPAERARLDQLALAVPDGVAYVEALSHAWSVSAVARPAKHTRIDASLSRRGLIAAGLTGLFAIGMASWLLTGRGRLYVAPADGPLHATLADGTRLALSPGGQVRVQFEPSKRYVVVLKGETLWAVAHDAQRPFEIAVGHHRLNVLGTRFNVEPNPTGLRVDLLEGALRVAGGDDAPVVLAPGERYWANHKPLVTAADVAGQAAWVDGKLIFDDASLAEVAVRIRLQTGYQLAFADDRLSQLRFSGLLTVGDVSGWRLGLEAALPVKAVTTPDGLKLYSRS